MTKLELPQVTLIAVTSINLDATLQAIETCRQHAEFGACKLITHWAPKDVPGGVDIVSISRVESSHQYSRIILNDLVHHVDTSHCLVTQWDGHVVNPDRWDPRFLDYDYIGASWPQFADGRDVGNGGFSLRSRRLLEACRSPKFVPSHPEDVAIGRGNRTWLEAQGLRFAPREVADAFSAERAGSLENAFGFHGVWHMPKMLGADRFWDIYCGLEDRSSVFHDRSTIMRQLVGAPHGIRRCLQMGWDGLWQQARYRTGRA